MTSVYFVRHAQPDSLWEDDRTRPLTQEGKQDCRRVAAALAGIQLDYAVSSPYVRSVDTIRPCAEQHGLAVFTDERFRERETGPGGKGLASLQMRWRDYSYHEEGGECLQSVQDRNIEALQEVLLAHQDEAILLGTHGTALATILNYYDKTFQCGSFLRMIDFMPYILKADFCGLACIGKHEVLVMKKESNRR